MKFKIYFFSILLLTGNCCLADDTTGLYQKRIFKIKLLSEWLTANLEREELIDRDSLKNNPLLNIAINKFFDKHILDSLDKHKENDVSSLSFKLKMLRESITGFGRASKQIGFSRLKFKSSLYPDEQIEAITNYFLIDNESLENFTFLFKKGSPALIGIISNGYPASKFKKVNQHPDSLRINH